MMMIIIMIKMLTAVETDDVDNEFADFEQRHKNYQKWTNELLQKNYQILFEKLSSIVKLAKEK